MEFSFNSESFQREWIELAKHVSTENENNAGTTNINPYPALNEIILKFNLKNFEECIYCRNLPVLNLEKSIKSFFERLNVNEEAILYIDNRIVLLTDILGILFNFCQEYRFRHIDKDQSVENFVWLITSNTIFYTNKLFYHGVNTLPFDLIKQKYEESNLYKVDEIKEKIDQCINNIEAWDNSFLTKKDDVKKLEEKLENYKTTYDFVLLNEGFKNLYDQKKEDLKSPESNYKWLFRFILAIPVFEIIFFGWLIANQIEINSVAIWYMVVPSISLILFLFYFYRINLQEIRSIKSQMMQIELRMALCQFIHKYADESEKLHQKNTAGFEKFENIIFSPLVSSDDKIPTTFDGIEQLANLVSQFRNK